MGEFMPVPRMGFSTALAIDFRPVIRHGRSSICQAYKILTLRLLVFFPFCLLQSREEAQTGENSEVSC